MKLFHAGPPSTSDGPSGTPPGHVTGVFEQRDEEEEKTDLRQEDHHGADALDDAVGQEILKSPGPMEAPHLSGDPLDPGVDGVHGQFRE